MNPFQVIVSVLLGRRKPDSSPKASKKDEPPTRRNDPWREDDVPQDWPSESNHTDSGGAGGSGDSSADD